MKKDGVALSAAAYKYVTQRQLMRLFAVKVILSYEQKCEGKKFSKIKVC